MCAQVKCRDCGKPTWSGCGRHIEQALANVPVQARCKCREQKSSDASNGTGPQPKKFFFF